jgi:flagellar basal body-associated protein FliL
MLSIFYRRRRAHIGLRQSLACREVLLAEYWGGTASVKPASRWSILWGGRSALVAVPKLVLLPALLLVILAWLFALPELRRQPSSSHQAAVYEAYTVPGGFLIDLPDDHLALFEVALTLTPRTAERVRAIGDGQRAVTLADGAVASPKEATIRTIISERMARQPVGRLRSRAGRERLQRRLRRDLARRAGIPVRKLLFTELAVR